MHIRSDLFPLLGNLALEPDLRKGERVEMTRRR